MVRGAVIALNIAAMIGSLAGAALGQPAVEDEPEPVVPGVAPEREVIDLTRGMRTDPFTTAALGPDRTLYVGTLKGRIYRRTTRGDWDELTVLPEVKELFGFANQFVLLGHLRRDDSSMASPLNLHPTLGVTPGHAAQSLALLHGGLENTHFWGPTSSSPIGDRASSLQLGEALPWGGTRYYANPLETQNASVLEGSAIAAGAGLSARRRRVPRPGEKDPRGRSLHA